MDYYESLGVSPNASDAVIRAAYRTRLKEVHPDTGLASAELDEVLEAGAVLLEPSKRTLYDQQRAVAQAPLPRRLSWKRESAAAVVAVSVLALFFILRSAGGSADEVLSAGVLPDFPSSDSSPAEDVPAQPAVEPAATAVPTAMPTVEPAVVPTVEPAVVPTVVPAVEPTVVPTVVPTVSPTVVPTVERSALPDLESIPERGAIYRAPTLFLVGAVPSQEMADAFYNKAVAVVGEENVVDEYVIHPDAPLDVNGNVRVEQAITFETNSAVIRSPFVPILGLALEVLTQNPQASLVIEGHTDSVGDAPKNQVLSERRAAAVVDWLVERGIDPARLSSVGYGESEPVADNATPEGRAINRRIEVQIVDLLR